MTRRLTTILVLVLTAAACGHRPAPAQTPATQVSSDSGGALVPVGLGQLNQDVITLRLKLPNLEIRFTPLDERVTRLLANDGYQSLDGMRTRNQAAIDSVVARQGLRRPGLVLVSFFGLAPNTSFDPSLLLLVDSRNRPVRPAGFVPLSASFSAQRLDVRDQAMGIVIYETVIPVTEPFTLTYLDASTDEWQRRLSRFDRERARIQAKATNAPAPGTP
ncbi:MAG TPA: hypothetical protein VFN22_00715 [Gemmatimonadales bacterium]|nr:hypothetical protein [Gemmatimonadales bacterium]